MKSWTEWLREVVAGARPDRAGLRRMLELEKPAELAELYRAAYQVKLAEVGNQVRLRGLIEISNYCTKNCYYCGIRRDNRAVHRFALTLPEIRAAATHAWEFGYGSVVLQSGERSDPEFVDYIEQAVRELKELSRGELGITLSCGEQSAATYRRWFAAGAHRYLLRIESSTLELYRALHPADHDYAERRACLGRLREAGFQVGTGVMIGLPGQTVDHLVNDLEFFRELDIDMIGMGPYLPHSETPLGRAVHDFDPERQLTLGLKMIAAARLSLRDVNIAATTALQTLAPDGRERGLLAGANVIMPNVGEVEHRPDYLLYDHKPGLDENAAESRERLEQSLLAIGEQLAPGEWGDSPHFARRRGGSRA